MNKNKLEHDKPITAKLPDGSEAKGTVFNGSTGVEIISSKRECGISAGRQIKLDGRAIRKIKDAGDSYYVDLSDRDDLVE